MERGNRSENVRRPPVHSGKERRSEERIEAQAPGGARHRVHFRRSESVVRDVPRRGGRKPVVGAVTEDVHPEESPGHVGADFLGLPALDWILRQFRQNHRMEGAEDDINRDKEEVKKSGQQIEVPARVLLPPLVRSQAPFGSFNPEPTQIEFVRELHLDLAPNGVAVKTHAVVNDPSQDDRKKKAKEDLRRSAAVR
jgi:hypothetical protein